MAASSREGALLEWIQQLAPYGVITLDEELRVLSWNHWMEIHSAKVFADVAGKEFFALFPDVEERKLRPYFERALKGEPSVLSTSLHRYLVPLPPPFGEKTVKHMLQTSRVAPLFTDGQVCGAVIVIEDVTQREIQALTLGAQHRRDEILSWALAHLLKTDDPRKSVRHLFFKIAEHLDFDAFLLYLREQDDGPLGLYTSGGLPAEAEKIFAGSPFDGLLPPNARNVVILDSVRKGRDSGAAFLRQADVSAAIILPLCTEERNLGLLCFTTASRPTIGPEEAGLLTTITQCLAVSLDRDNTRRQLQAAKEQLSDQARGLEKTVQERTAQLQSTIGELETFSYAVAHDLREPVRGLIGFCDVLLEDFGESLPAEARRVVDRLSRTSRRMETLTRDLLAFSSIARQQVALGRVDVGAIVRDILALRVGTVQQAVTLKEPLHDVLAHEALLQQALSNLIDNAMKFVTPGASPRITIWTEVKNGTTPGRRVRIWVADEGIGIPAEMHQKVFGIFERGQNSEMYEGTGMGLAIVARTIQRMGGSCGVESEPGKGSRFWLELAEAP